MTAHTHAAQQLRDIADFISLLPDDIETPNVDSTGTTFYVFDHAPAPEEPVAQERADRVAEVLGGVWTPEEYGSNEQFARFRCQYTLGGRPVFIVGYRGQVETPAPRADVDAEPTPEVVAS